MTYIIPKRIADQFRGGMELIQALNSDDEPCPDCDHDEHDASGCRGYTPEWPRLVRCPCTRVG